MMTTATTHNKINNNRFAFSDLIYFTLCIQEYSLLPKAALAAFLLKATTYITVRLYLFLPLLSIFVYLSSNLGKWFLLKK